MSRIEAGERVPSLQIIFRVADYLGVGREWLAMGSTSEADDPHEELLRLRAENERLQRTLGEIRAHADDALSRRS